MNFLAPFYADFPHSQDKRAGISKKNFCHSLPYLFIHTLHKPYFKSLIIYTQAKIRNESVDVMQLKLMVKKPSLSWVLSLIELKCSGKRFINRYRIFFFFFFFCPVIRLPAVVVVNMIFYDSKDDLKIQLNMNFNIFFEFLK